MSRVVLSRGIRWRVWDGKSINVWSALWLRDSNNFLVETSIFPSFESINVSDLMIPGVRDWDFKRLNDLFSTWDVAKILKISVSKLEFGDRLMWYFEKNGIYLV